MAELKKEKVNMLRVKSRATSQLTFDEDYNVPDVKPDIGRMIQNKGEIQIEEVKLGENKAHIRAFLVVDLLYVGEEEEGNIHSLTAKLPIEEGLNLEGLESGDKIRLKWEIEDVSLHLIHSRKLNVKAVVTFYAVVDEPAQLYLPIDLQEQEKVSVQKKKLQMLELVIHKKDTMRIREEINLASNKPNLYEVLWNTMEVRGLEIRPEEGKVAVRGELFLFVLYAGDDEGNPLQWMEHSIPFHGEAACEGCTLDMIPDVEVTVLSQGLEVKPDADGEERLLQADVVLELDMKGYQEREQEILTDVYTPVKTLTPLRHEELLESLLIRNFSKCRVSDRVQIAHQQEKILQICHSCGNVKIDDTRIVKDGILVEGAVQVKVLYIVGNDHMPFYSAEAMVPFSHTVEAAGISEDCSYRLHTDLEQLSTTMVDSNEIEVKLVLNVNALVRNRQREQIMDRVEEAPLDLEAMQEMPGVTVYFVKQGDTLWDIAKTFYTTVDQICQVNGLEKEEITPYQPLILVKKVEN